MSAGYILRFGMLKQKTPAPLKAQASSDMLCTVYGGKNTRILAFRPVLLYNTVLSGEYHAAAWLSLYFLYRKGVLTIFTKHYDNNQKLTFRIVDSPMGIGKSSSLLEYLHFGAFYFNDDSIQSLRRTGIFDDLEKARFIIFVSTIRERDERFLQELNAKSPEQPPYNKSILELIRDGENIVTTQSLFGIFNDETIKAFRESDCAWHAFFDEIPSLFRGVIGGAQRADTFDSVTRFGTADVLLMQQEQMIANKNGMVQFNPNSAYNRKNKEHKVFDAVKLLSRSCKLYPAGDKKGRFTSIVAFAKRELFSCFKVCWFFSYLTHGSMLHKYCLLNDINMEYYHISDGCITKNPDGKFKETYPDGMERLVILDDKLYNMETSLSKEWYKRLRTDRTGLGLKTLKTRFRNAYEFMQKHGVRGNTFMFTTFNAYRNMLQSDGRHYPTLKRFLPCNTKATNDYSNCTGVAYLCNRFYDVNCTNFLSQRAEYLDNPELKFDNDNYALSELLQFVWRSNVRVKDSDKPVYVWVPDRRMRQLLQDFRQRALKFKKDDC